MSLRLVRFNNVALPQSGDAAESSTPQKARNSYEEMLNGGFDNYRGTLYLGMGKISHRFMIVQDMDNQMRLLTKQLGKGRGVLFAKDRAGVEYATYAKLDEFTRVVKSDDYLCNQPMTVNWVTEYPYWWLEEDGWFFDTGETFDSGLYFDGNYEEYTITNSPFTFGIDNNGTARAADGTLYIIPQTASSIINPRLSNLTNGLSVQYEGTVNANEQLVIDFLTKTGEVDGSPVAITLSGERQNEWMALETDTNSLRFTGTITGTVKLYWVWKRHFL